MFRLKITNYFHILFNNIYTINNGKWLYLNYFYFFFHFDKSNFDFASNHSSRNISDLNGKWRTKCLDTSFFIAVCYTGKRVKVTFNYK